MNEFKQMSESMRKVLGSVTSTLQPPNLETGKTCIDNVIEDVEKYSKLDYSRKQVRNVLLKLEKKNHIKIGQHEEITLVY